MSTQRTIKGTSDVSRNTAAQIAQQVIDTLSSSFDPLNGTIDCMSNEPYFVNAS